MGLLELEKGSAPTKAPTPAPNAIARRGRDTLFAASASDAAARMFPDWLEDVRAWPADRLDARPEEKLPLGIRMLVILGLAIAAWIPVFAMAALL